MERLMRLLQHPLLQIWFSSKSGVVWAITAIASIAGGILAVWQLFKGQDQGEHPAEPRNQSRVDALVGTAGENCTRNKSQEAKTSSCGGLVGGARLVTVCVPGVLLHETTTEEIEDSATLRKEVVEPLQRLLQGGGRVVFIAHTVSEVGAAAVQAALEEAGLLGASSSQLPPHRLLSCSTRGGKASIVRQLEPDVHLESDVQAASDVRNFVEMVVIVNSDAHSSADPAFVTVATLADVLG